MNRFIPTLLTLVALATVGALTAQAGGEHPDNVTLCHASGLEGTTKYETLTVGYPAAFGPAGHFDENGTPNAGHEQDYLGECVETPPFDQCPDIPGDQPEGTDCNPPVDYCPTLPGVQAQDEDCPAATPVTAGVSFTEPTCDTPAAFILTKTFPGLRFYNVEGPDLVDGHPVPGGTYTLTALIDEGFLLEGDGVFVHTFNPAPTNCGTPPPPGTPVGNATVICLMPAAIYQLSGTVDGQAADTVTPATLPGTTKGITNVTVTRGDTSVRTTVNTNGDCVTPTVPGTTAVAAAVVTTPPAAKPPAAKPVVKPKPPVRKPAAKPKPKHKTPKPAPPKHKTPQAPPHTLGTT